MSLEEKIKKAFANHDERQQQLLASYQTAVERGLESGQIVELSRNYQKEMTEITVNSMMEIRKMVS